MTLKASMFEVHCIPDACAQINLVATKDIEKKAILYLVDS